MIIVVEGPSASGKTTYAAAQGGPSMVPEYASVGPPVDASPPDRADFWARQNSARWKAALQIEGSLGLALCDTDPLHYDYSLHAIGLVDRSTVLAGVAVCRRAIERRSIGMADLVLCSIPDAQTLVSKRRRASATLMAV